MRPYLNDAELEAARPHLERAVDCLDQWVDILLDERQSGHPGGSRSKNPMQVALLFSGALRCDLRRPERPLNDRYVLAAGHATPMLYSSLALATELLAAHERRTGDRRAAIPRLDERAVRMEDLMRFRRRGGLPGHAEFAGKTLFVKANTGPSGHGFPNAVGQAFALRAARAAGVRVWTVEGEGGLTPGGASEARNAAWGLGLGNLVLLLDWNDFGIDERPFSSVIPGTPVTWLEQGGWRVHLVERGEDPVELARGLLVLSRDADDAGDRPLALVFRTRKGRGYGKFDAKSHGSPHKRRSPEFWATKHPFAEKYGVRFEGQDEAEPADAAVRRSQALANLAIVRDVLLSDEQAATFLAERLLAAADAVPDRIPGLRLESSCDPLTEPRITDPGRYPAALFHPPGASVANRQGLGRWGAYVNAVAHEISGRPLLLACAADLAESTAIAGVAKGWESFPGFGDYERTKNPDGVLLPQAITEFTNAAMMAGAATVNLAGDPERAFRGFCGACATYGSFSYLKYGPLRLFSQTAQDCPLRLGKVIWVAGHSGPETAEDSRTHFGIFSPYVTELFPRGQVIDLHPFDVNEAMVLLGAALGAPAPLLAVTLTRPNTLVPDREALGVPSYLEAARGAYVLREADPARPLRGTVLFRGATPVGGALEILRKHAGELPNVRLVAIPSRYLFDRQPEAYRESVLPWPHLLDSMVVTSGARATAHAWLASRVSEDYSLGADQDDRWRTGGTLEEVLEEAGLLPEQILEGIIRFADAREARLARLHAAG
ncbi:MAG: transketolase [Deltaproteobacteria bacterium]|nr:transketolase [Deltaproteobacteria bacterium]